MKDREVDITPVGWTFPEIEHWPAILDVICGRPIPGQRPNPNRGLFLNDGVGILARVDRFVVLVADLDDVPVLERARRARILLGTIQEAQRLEAAHESGRYEEARAAAVARAQKAMARVGSKFVIDHPKDSDENAPY